MPQLQSAIFYNIVEGIYPKLKSALRTIKNDAAARGFEFLPGRSQMAMVEEDMAFKRSAYEANAKLYAEFREHIVVKLSELQDREQRKLDEYNDVKRKTFEFREELREMGKKLELAEQEGEADALIWAANGMEARNIQLMAEVEEQVTAAKAAALAAQSATLEAEAALAQAKMIGATAKMGAISPLLAAAGAEMEAATVEQGAVALRGALVSAKGELASAKSESVGAHEQKAGAKSTLASAAQEEVASLIALAGLGNVRAEIKSASWAAESSYLAARLNQAIADGVKEVAMANSQQYRANADMVVEQASNAVRTSLVGLRSSLEAEKAEWQYGRRQLMRAGDEAAAQAEASANASAMAQHAAQIYEVVLDGGARVADALIPVTYRTSEQVHQQIIKTSTSSTIKLQRKISKG